MYHLSLKVSSDVKFVATLILQPNIKSPKEENVPNRDITEESIDEGHSEYSSKSIDTEEEEKLIEKHTQE